MMTVTMMVDVIASAKVNASDGSECSEDENGMVLNHHVIVDMTVIMIMHVGISMMTIILMSLLSSALTVHGTLFREESPGLSSPWL